MKVKKIIIWFVLVICIVSQFNFPVLAENESDSLKALSKKGDSIISINLKNADICDVLSALAVNMGCNIIYIDSEEPEKIDLSIQDVTVEDALDYFLKSMGKEYIKDKNTIIAGPREVLENNYMDRIALTKFNLKYIRSDVLASQINALSIPVKTVTLHTNDKVIWVQGLPSVLSKVAELIAMIDKAENLSLSEYYKLTPISLNYITAEQLGEVLSTMGFYRGLIIESNPMTLWIYGTEKDVTMANEVKTQLDIEQNAVTNNFIFKRKNLLYLTSSKARDILSELGIDVNIISLDRKMKTVWLNGTEKAVDLALSVLNELDIEDYMEHNHMTVYNLKNITAKEAMARLSFIQNEKNVKFYTFNFPQFAKSIMVFCSQDYRLYILNQLEEIDVTSDEIKVPVDYSTSEGGSRRLKNRRDLICELTGLSEDQFTISSNVSREDKKYMYVMYLEESPEVIQYVKDVIKMIDNPLSEGSY